MNTNLENKIRRKLAHKQSMYAELEQSRRPESWSATHPAYAGTGIAARDEAYLNRLKQQDEKVKTHGI